jgi:hypothetical protein
VLLNFATMTERTKNQTPKKEPVWLVKINAFFSKSLLWSETDALVAAKTRAFAKWWLALLRNVMVVAVLQYVARKSDKLAVKIIAGVSFFMLLGYCLSYLQSWSLNPFFFIKNRHVQLLAYMIFGVALGVALLFSISAGIGSAIDEIPRMQRPG